MGMRIEKIIEIYNEPDRIGGTLIRGNSEEDTKYNSETIEALQSINVILHKYQKIERILHNGFGKGVYAVFDEIVKVVDNGDDNGDDNTVKAKLLYELSKESTMVISTAYAYAKNYVNYGVDITKAWGTVTEQVSVIQEVKEKVWVEACDSFKKEYENRLKADILTELQTEIEGLPMYNDPLDISDLIQQKIDSLKETK